MNRTQKTTRISTLLAVLMIGFILVGCSSPTVVAQPTQDIPAIRTESAATVVSKLTIEAALNPTATAAAPQVITATPEPTTEATAEATATVAAAPTDAPAATATVAVVVQPTATNRPVTGGGSGAIPTATRRAGPDQGQFIGQEPSDGTRFSPGNQFDVRYTVKNIGTSTWSTDYDIRFESGTNFAEGKPKTIPFPKNVAPGETVTFVFDAVAPPDAGRYTGYWSLINGNGDIFYEFYLIIDVQ